MGGRPHRKFFGSVLVKILNMHSKDFLQCFLIVFLQNPSNLYMFGHKVGPKHRFLQCCFNLFFKNNIIYTFFKIKLVQNTGFCSAFNTLTSQILGKHLYLICICFFVFVRFFVAGSLPSPFFRCQKPPKTTQNSISIPSWPPTRKNRPKNYENTSRGRVSVRKF